MTSCKYYDNGKCKVLGEKVTINCQTVKKIMPSLCKEKLKNKLINRKNDKRNGFSGTSGKIDKKN